jgi:hypothetical protein
MKKMVFASLVVVLFSGMALNADESNLDFDKALQQAISELRPGERAWLEHPILDHSKWLEECRRQVSVTMKDYAPGLVILKGKELEDAKARLEQAVRAEARNACFFMVRWEGMERKFHWNAWLDAPSPLLQELALPAAGLKQRGFEPAPHTCDSPDRVTLQGKGPHYDYVKIMMRPNREMTRDEIQNLGDMSSTASDFELCRTAVGEACLARASRSGSETIDFKFARANVVVELRGQTTVLEPFAEWLDASIRDRVATAGKAVTTISKPVLTVQGAVICRPPAKESDEKARFLERQGKKAAEKRADDILLIEEPKMNSPFGVVVPDGTTSVKVRVRVLDPEVETVDIDNGQESKKVVPVNGIAEAEIPLHYRHEVINAFGRRTPRGEDLGIVAFQTISVYTKTGEELFRLSLPYPDKVKR